LNRNKSLNHFKFISIDGLPYERGCQYGEQAKTVIERSLEAYYTTVEYHNPQLNRKDLLQKALEFVPFIEKYDPEIMKEIQGIAAGAEKPLEEIMFLNARAELYYPQMRFSGKEHLAECSTISVTPEASSSGHTIVAENWDPWTLVIRLKPYVILKIEQEDKPDSICFTEAGIVGGKIGFNSAGIGLGVNGLFTDRDGDEFGVPWSAICRGVLNANSWYAATNAVLRAKRSISLNYNISTVEGEAICVETAPGYEYDFHYSESGVTPHTNHFVSDIQKNCSDPAFQARVMPSTVSRYLRLRKLALQKVGELNVENIQEIMRDHFNYPNSICFHPRPGFHENETSGTGLSVISDLNEKVMYVAAGPPCEYEYERVPLKLM
jgi:isopenicillin-N N-acyltransferase-like protein